MVVAVGALYPAITPSHTPVPLVSASTAAAVPAPSPAQDADAPNSTPQWREPATLNAAVAVSQHGDGANIRAESGPSLVAAPIAPTTQMMIVRSEPSADASLPAPRRIPEPEAEHLEIVATNAAGEESATQEEEPGLNSKRIAAQQRSTPPQGRGRARSRHRPNKKPRGSKGQNEHLRVQDRHTDDRQETDGRTTPCDTGNVRAETFATGRERRLEHLRLKSQATMLVSGDGSTIDD